MKTKLTKKFWTALVLFSLIGQVAWVVENMYLNVFMYKMFNASAGDISAMVAASAVAATLTTVFIGALSDKIGKRKLFMCGGYILWGIVLKQNTYLSRTIKVEKNQKVIDTGLYSIVRHPMYTASIILFLDISLVWQNHLDLEVFHCV